MPRGSRKVFALNRALMANVADFFWPYLTCIVSLLQLKAGLFNDFGGPSLAVPSKPFISAERSTDVAEMLFRTSDFTPQVTYDQDKTRGFDFFPEWQNVSVSECLDVRKARKGSRRSGEPKDI